MEAGHPVPITPVTMADGLGAASAGDWTLPIAARLVDGFVVVSEATIARGVVFALERMKQLLEPAGAAALGAVLAGSHPDPGRGDRRLHRVRRQHRPASAAGDHGPGRVDGLIELGGFEAEAP